MMPDPAFPVKPGDVQRRRMETTFLPLIDSVHQKASAASKGVGRPREGETCCPHLGHGDVGIGRRDRRRARSATTAAQAERSASSRVRRKGGIVEARQDLSDRVVGSAGEAQRTKNAPPPRRPTVPPRERPVTDHWTISLALVWVRS